MASLTHSGVGGLNVEIEELKGSSLELHLAPEVESDLLKGRCVSYNTVSVVEDTEGAEFHIPADPECFLVLNQARLLGSIEVRDDDGGTVSAADDVSLSQHYAACLFSHVEIYFNGTQVCDLSSPVSYPYKHFIDWTLSYQMSVLNNVGRAEGYHVSEREAVEPTDEDKKVFHNNIVDGKKVYFNTTIPADVLYTDKYLPPNVEITMKLARFNPKFGVVNKQPGKSFGIHLKDLVLQMWKVLPSERVRDRFQSNLLHRPCFLPYKDSQLKHFHIPQGTGCFSANHINNGQLPNQIFFVFVNSQLLTRGGCDKQPFKFQNYHLTSAILKKNGKPLLPRPLECNFEEGDYIELYEHFQSNVGTKNRITLKNFKEELMILAFDLTPDKCNSFHNHQPVTGNLELDLTFGEDTTFPITLMSYAFFTSGIFIDNNLQVIKQEY